MKLSYNPAVPARPLFRGSRWFVRATVLSIGAAISLSILPASAQGPYYPVTNPGGPYGSTYTGTPVASYADSAYIQATLQTIRATISTQVPVPTGFSAPTSAELAQGALLMGQQLALGPVGSVTTSSVARALVEYRPADRMATVGAVAQGIVAGPSGSRITSLNTLAANLSTAFPTTIDSILPAVLAKAATSADTAAAIPQIVNSATTWIPSDRLKIGSIVANGLSSICTSVLTPVQRAALVLNQTDGYIKQVLNAPVNALNPSLIDTYVQAFTNASVASVVPPVGPLSSLDQILQATVQALPPVAQTNVNLSAVAVGAIRSQPANVAAIKSRLATESAGTATYTNALADSYTASTNLANFQNFVTANPSLADAAATGAVLKGAVTPAIVVQWALRNGTANKASTVQAAVAGNTSAAAAIAGGAIDPVSHTPWGGATFAEVASGVVKGADINTAGSTISSILVTAGVTFVSSANLNSIVDAAISGAASTGKAGAFADIVNKATYAMKNVAGTVAPMVRQAIDSISAATSATAASDRPTYIAVMAALAGDINGYNRVAIRDAAFGVGGQIQATGGDVVAATNGADLILAIQTNAVGAYNSTINKFASAAAGPSANNSTYALLYASVLSNSSESAASLAAAIQRSSISANLLIKAAIDARRVTSTNDELMLQTVGTVASYAKANPHEALAYVGQQIVANPTLSTPIATAWTVVDPGHAHWVSHAVGFNAPDTAAPAITAIFRYAQITNNTPSTLPMPLSPTGTPAPIKDQPGAAAAITAGVVTGILEANRDANSTKNYLSSTVTAAVLASVTQSGTYLLGQANPFNAPGDETKSFRQSDGGVGTIKSGIVKSTGPAGAITGFVAQVTKATDTTISATTAAVLTAASAGNARYYALEIAQAAAQALRWVSTATWTPATADAAATAIAAAINTSVAGFSGYDLTKLKNAALFGISEAENGTLGAGALGLGSATTVVKASGNAKEDFYIHRSAQGTPVTDIFNL